MAVRREKPARPPARVLCLCVSGKLRRWHTGLDSKNGKRSSSPYDLFQKQAGGPVHRAVCPTGHWRPPISLPDDSAHLASCAAVVGSLDSSSPGPGISSSGCGLSGAAACERNRRSGCPRRGLGFHTLASDPDGRGADRKRAASRGHAMGSNHRVGPRSGARHVARSR